MYQFSVNDVCDELRTAQFLLTHVGLHSSASWAAELIEDLDEKNPILDAPPPVEFDPDPHFCYGQDLFAEMDYERAAAAFTESRSQYAIFMQFYSQHLSLQKQATERCLDPKKLDASKNVDNGILEQEVREALQKEQNNALLLYILGLILIDQRRMKEAHQCLIISVQLFQSHWGAWEALVETIVFLDGNVDEAVPNGSRWIAPFVRARAFDVMNRPTDAANEIEEIEEHFPNSRFMLELKGNVEHKLRNPTAARAAFETVMNRDPHRINSVHLFSNALLAADAKVDDICRLATMAAQTDPHRPETCCAVGNYYTEINEDNKAVEYFEKALKIDKNFSTAWTLLGHRYLKWQDFPKASNAYSRAIELDPYDYRAWYGLGQIEHRQSRNAIAIQHCKKALSIKKDDHRIWALLGASYIDTKIALFKTGIRCVNRAMELGSTDIALLDHMAMLYELDGQTEKAEQWYWKYLERAKSAQHKNVPVMIRALLFVGKGSVKKNNITTAQSIVPQLESLGNLAKTAMEELVKYIEDHCGAADPKPADDTMQAD